MCSLTVQRDCQGGKSNDLICNENIHRGWIFSCTHYILDPQLGQYYQIAGWVSANCACPRWWVMIRCMQVCSSVKRPSKIIYSILYKWAGTPCNYHVKDLLVWTEGGGGGWVHVCVCTVGVPHEHTVSGCHPESWFRWIMLSHICSVSVSRWSLSRLIKRGHPQLRAEVPWNFESTGD